MGERSQENSSSGVMMRERAQLPSTEPQSGQQLGGPTQPPSPEPLAKIQTGSDVLFCVVFLREVLT